MKIHAVLGLLVPCLLAATAGTAAAQADQTPGPQDPQGPTLSPYQRIFIPVTLPPPDGVTERATPHAPPHRVLYLNNCKPNGCVIKPGRNSGIENSRTNTSVIVSGTTNRTLQAYSGSTANWNAIVTCVKATYAQFNIGVTDVDPCPNPDANPSCQTGHWEAMAAGLPAQVGMPSGVAGVAPSDCSVIPNAMTFSFINLFPTDINEACWTIAQETAHAFGLAHEMLGADPMTYIQAPASKRFQNQSACVGTQGCCQPASECRCGPTMQNSVEMLLGIFGTSMPTPPTIAITNPTSGAMVTPGFPIAVTASDEQGVQKVDLLIDNVLIASISTPPYAFNGPATLTEGTHTIVAKAVDNLQAEATATVTVNVGPPCDSADDCGGNGLVCVGGRCVPGPDNPGGLGTPCTNVPGECSSGQCIGGAEGMFCTEPCDPNGNSCPSDFRCAKNEANPTQGFCYPDPGGCLGCSTDGRDPTLPLGIGLVGAALLFRRRRRRPAA